jgi:hypothetical protein
MDRADPVRSGRPMDHAQVLDRLEEAFFGPGHLATIDTDASDTGEAVRRHLAGCERCRAEYDALATTGTLLAMAAPESLAPSPEVRARVLATVAATGRARDRDAARTPTSGVRRRRATIVAGLAAAAVVLLLVGGAVLGPFLAPRGASDPDEGSRLAAVGRVMDRLLADPSHRSATLVDDDGDPAGTVVIGGATPELAVISTSLEKPPGDLEYFCFVVRGAERTSIGRMHFRGDTAYWAGPIDVADAGRAGDRFVVILDGAGNDPALSGQF